VVEQLKYKPVDLFEEFVVHLKNLKDLATFLSDKLDSIRFMYDVDEFRLSHLVPLRTKIKKIEIRYNIFRSLGK
jgi:hypothetical protein